MWGTHDYFYNYSVGGVSVDNKNMARLQAAHGPVPEYSTSQSFNTFPLARLCVDAMLCYYQGLDFDDTSFFFPCDTDDAIQYINLGYGAQAPKINFIVHFFIILCFFFSFR